MRQLARLEFAHTVLGADRSVKALDLVKHQGVHFVFKVAQEGFAVTTLRRLNVVVQVAVAQVPKVHHAHAGHLTRQQGVGLGHKVRDARDRDADVVLDVQALLHLGQGDAFSDVPQAAGLREVFGDDGIAYAAAVQGRFEQRFKLFTGMTFAFAVGVFQQHTPRGALPQGHTQLRVMLVHQAERKLVHDLKAREARAQALVGQAQQLHRRIHAGHGGPGCQLCGGLGVELQGGGGDDAQCAFAADHQVAQVIARVVFAQAR